MKASYVIRRAEKAIPGKTWAVLVFVFASCLVSTCAPLRASTTLDYYRSGFSYYKRRDFARAARIWRALLKHRRSELTRKQQLRTCLGLAKAYARLGKRRNAIRVLRFANRNIAPGHKAIRRVYSKIARGGRRRRHGRKAGLSLGEALEALDTGMMMEKATSGQGRPHFLEALPVFRKTVSSDDSNWAAHYGLGTCLLYTGGELDEAEKHLKKAHELMPDDYRVNLRLAECCRRRDDLEGEIRYLDQAVNNGASAPEDVSALAIAYAKRGKPGDRELVLRHARTAIARDSSYGVSIADQVTDEKLKIEIGKMVARAEMKAYGVTKRQQQQAKRLVDKLAKNPRMVDKLKKKYGDNFADKLASKIPARYRKIFERNKDKIMRYLKK